MNNFLKVFRYVFIHTSLWLAFGAAGVAFMTFVVLQSALKIEAILIAFLATFFLYNLNKKTDIIEDSINYPERVKFIKTYGNALFIIGIFSYIIAAFLALFNNLITFLITLTPFILTFLYSVMRLKKLFLIKDAIVPLGWSMTPLLVISYISFNPIFFIIPLFIFSRSFIITICYDTKDTTGDTMQGIKTIPSIYGIAFTKKILYILNILFFLIISSLSIFLNLYLLIPLAVIVSIYSIYYVSFIEKINIKNICEIISGGEYILLGVISYILWVLI